MLRCDGLWPYRYHNVFDNLVVKTLKHHHITPVRIDRKEHNNDVDDEIISELKKCDLVIADLSYARPSVYFEAGYAEGLSQKLLLGKPVIYTCNKSHFDHREDDVHGHFRVHFDLQMKNIIPWINADDRAFVKKLSSRISHVSKPLLQAKKIEEETRAKESDFTRLSIKDKTSVIFEEGIRVAKSAGFRGVEVRDNPRATDVFGRYMFLSPYKLLETFNITYPNTVLHRLKPNPLDPAWLGTLSEKEAITTAFIHVTPSISKESIRTLHESLLCMPIYNLMLQGGKFPLKVKEYLFVCSLAKTSTKRIMDALPHYSIGNTSKEFIVEEERRIPQRSRSEWKAAFSRGNGGLLEVLLNNGEEKRYRLNDSAFV